MMTRSCRSQSTATIKLAVRGVHAVLAEVYVFAPAHKRGKRKARDALRLGALSDTRLPLIKRRPDPREGQTLCVCLHMADEPKPSLRGEPQHGAGTVLGVPDEHAAIVADYLDAVAALGT